MRECQVQRFASVDRVQLGEAVALQLMPHEAVQEDVVVNDQNFFHRAKSFPVNRLRYHAAVFKIGGARFFSGGATGCAGAKRMSADCRPAVEMEIGLSICKPGRIPVKSAKNLFTIFHFELIQTGA